MAPLYPVLVMATFTHPENGKLSRLATVEGLLRYLCQNFFSDNQLF
jgi:hypothetical protein